MIYVSIVNFHLADSDMRMVADENLNRVIRTLGENNVTRIQVDTFSADHRFVCLYIVPDILKDFPCPV